MEMNQACEAGANLQMTLMSRFCKFKKQTRELSYASERRGKPVVS